MGKISKSLGLLMLLTLLSGCGQETMPAEVAVKPVETTAWTVPEETEPVFHAKGQLMCAAESEEAAREIAGLYGIELLRFRSGIAVFYTEEDLDAVIDRGRAQGWPELQVNGISGIS